MLATVIICVCSMEIIFERRMLLFFFSHSCFLVNFKVCHYLVLFLVLIAKLYSSSPRVRQWPREGCWFADILWKWSECIDRCEFIDCRVDQCLYTATMLFMLFSIIVRSVSFIVALFLVLILLSFEFSSFSLTLFSPCFSPLQTCFVNPWLSVVLLHVQLMC